MAESATDARRGFSGAARATTLASGITPLQTSIDLTDASTWAAADDNGPGRATISDGTSEEEIEFTAVSGNSLTGVTRGVGGTSAAAWSAGATVEHTSSVRDFDEANFWVNKLSGAASAANRIVYADGARDLAGLDVAASRFVGRKASGDLAAMTVAEAVTLLQGTELAEYIFDTVAAMFTGNTETNVTVTPQDADNTIDVEVTASAPEYIDIPANAFSLISGTRAEAPAAAGLPAGISLPDAATNYYSAMVRIPSGWTTASLEIYWSPTNTNTGNTRILSRFSAPYNDGDTMTTLLTSMTISAAPGPGTIGMLDVAAGAINIAVTPGEDSVVMIGREGADGGDTFTGGVIFHKARVVKAS